MHQPEDAIALPHDAQLGDPGHIEGHDRVKFIAEQHVSQRSGPGDDHLEVDRQIARKGQRAGG